ncbi:MAG: adenosylcobinamide-GDP ribazoletransferase [Candidatus Verstraetearchaeota archaeon]|nr:adenosylcobinamide-GDP ribazoletransferase [Candidatus Verstraetearchaeota archaeon]
MLKEIRNLVAFLTAIPVGMDKDFLADAAKCLPLFPLVGAFIGLLTGISARLLLWILPAYVVGMLTLGLLLLITGVHHTDGLLDFGDGIMSQGTPERKIEIMHDHNTGAGGLAVGLITLLTTAFCIAGLDVGIVIQSLILSETLAKLSMVIGAWAGRSAHEGMNTLFVGAMHDRNGKARLLVALAISGITAVGLLWITGLIALISSIIAALVLVGVSNRHFRGITGDVLGAMNELTRMSSLIVILAVVRWV